METQIQSMVFESVEYPGPNGDPNVLCRFHCKFLPSLICEDHVFDIPVHLVHKVHSVSESIQYAWSIHGDDL